MNLPQRIQILIRLGDYMLSDEPSWEDAREKAFLENGWFIPEFISRATRSIAEGWLREAPLLDWIAPYKSALAQTPDHAVGIVMAGNIPLVGFHDWLAVFLTGHKAVIKPSSKDNVLIRHLLDKLVEWEPETARYFELADRLKGCQAYIATGSTNSSRYFDYYFSKYPHIIRRNKTSVAILNGQETAEQLEALADDVYLYFGLGCRNVTKIYVPSGYTFEPLLQAFSNYQHLADHHKYKNNFDYHLALHILNKKFYMTNGSLLLVEEESLFSPISQLNYEYYSDGEETIALLRSHPDLQCLVGQGGLPFGQAQAPRLHDYADGINTLDFLTGEWSSGGTAPEELRRP